MSTGKNSQVDSESGVGDVHLSHPVSPTHEKEFDTNYPDGGPRAWLVAAGAAGMLLCTMGYVNSFGIFQAYYSEYLLKTENPSRIAWIGSLQGFFQLASGLVGGPLFDRYGAKVIWPASVMYVFSMMMTSLCKSYYQFILAQGLLGGISIGMAMTPTMAAIPQYFDKKRGAAMGIAIGGSSIGSVIFPIAIGRMLPNPRLGFPWTIRICAFIILFLLIFCCLSVKARLPPRKKQFFQPKALTDVSYVLLIFATFLMFFGMFTPLFYLPSYAIQHGMSQSLAAYLVSILNAASLPGRVIPGILSDKLGALNILFVAGISTGIMNFCWVKVTSNASTIVFAALFGFCSGAIISGGTVSLTLATKDPRQFGTYMGMGMFFGAFAILISPPINGALVDRYHSYKQVSILSGTLCVVGAFLILVVKTLMARKESSKK